MEEGGPPRASSPPARPCPEELLEIHPKCLDDRGRGGSRPEGLRFSPRSWEPGKGSILHQAMRGAFGALDDWQHPFPRAVTDDA
jgi:hypothetical protein